MPKTKSATNRRKKTGSASKAATARKPARAKGNSQGAVLVYCDASVMNLAAAGFVIQAGGQEIACKTEVLTGGDWLDVDAVEAVAIMRGLEYLLQLGMVKQPVIITSDSPSVIADLQSQHRLQPKTRVLNIIQATQDLMGRFPDLHLRWVPRLMNYRAHRLVQETTGKEIRAFEQAFATAGKSRVLA